MRIGILTLPLHINYGGILQAYALQTVLERMGHEVVIINSPLRYSLPLYKVPFVYAKRIIKKYVLLRKNKINEEYYNRECNDIIQMNTRCFIKRHLHLKHYNHLEEIDRNDFDAIVVGSDQIWRRVYVEKLLTNKPENVFLYFAKEWDIKRVAYAVSFGTDVWEFNKKQTLKGQEMLQTFNAVGVREISGIDLCRKKLNVDAQLVLDPTLLLSQSDYLKLFESKIGVPKNQIMAYILDENESFDFLIEKIVQKKKWNICKANVTNIGDKSINPYERIQPPVEDWLSTFYYSQFVVTDSFHACVFSIIFNKPFLVVANNCRGNSRIYSLLKIFHLEHCFVSDPRSCMITEKLFVKPNVNLNREKDLSIMFLKNSLSL